MMFIVKINKNHKLYMVMTMAATTTTPMIVIMQFLSDDFYSSGSTQ